MNAIPKQPHIPVSVHVGASEVTDDVEIFCTLKGVSKVHANKVFDALRKNPKFHGEALDLGSVEEAYDGSMKIRLAGASSEDAESIRSMVHYAVNDPALIPELLSRPPRRKNDFGRNFDDQAA